MELYACASPGQFPKKKIDNGVVRMRQLRTVSKKEREQMFRNLCGIRQNCNEISCLFGHAFIVYPEQR